MPSAKQQPSNIKHDVGIRPKVCKLTFGPLYILCTVIMQSYGLVTSVRKRVGLSGYCRECFSFLLSTFSVIL